MCSCAGPNHFGRISGMTRSSGLTNSLLPPGPVLIVGAGLIGTSIGMRLRESGVQVILDDLDAAATEVAIRRGAGQLIAPGSTAPNLVVVAVPPGSVVDVACDLLARYPGAIVCDVASTKAGIVAGVAERAGSAATRFVGTHPMAGREVSGPGGARADLFEYRRWVITPTRATSPAAVDAAVRLAETCDAVIVRMEPAAHDRAVALTSHLPQIVASALAARLVDAPGEDVLVTGQGLRDMTRIADSDPGLWADILTCNRDEVVPALNQLVDELQRVAGALTGENVESAAVVAGLVERGAAGRSMLPAKHGGPAPKYASVTVVVGDRPGELGRLFATAGRAEVNLEDVRVEHSVGRLSAFVELSVLSDRVGQLSQALADEDWEVLGD